MTPADSARCQVHLDRPADAPCSRCGTFACAECLQPNPDGSRLCPKCQARYDPLPWDERERLGVLAAWWRTCLLMVSAPVRTMSSVQPDANIGSSVYFMALSAVAPTLGLVVAMLPQLLLERSSWPVRLATATVTLVAMIGWQLAVPLINALLDHLALWVLRAPPAPVSVTIRSQALSTGVFLIGAIPLCGFYVFPLWALVLRILGLVHLRQVGPLKACAAVFIPMVFCVGLIGAIVAVSFYVTSR